MSEENNKYDVLAPAQVFDYFDDKMEGDRTVKVIRYNAGTFWCIISAVGITTSVGLHWAAWVAFLTLSGLIFIFGITHLLISR